MEEDNTISLKDFKSWLQGVEDMQDEGWIPNATQWKKIRQKIDQIAEAPALQARPPVAPVPAGPVPRPWGDPRPMMEQPAIPSAFDSSSKVSTFVPPPGAPRVDNPKTPDIDTSNGQYTSVFV